MKIWNFTFNPYHTRFLYMPQSSQIFIHLACRNTASCKSRAENGGDPDQLASENLNPEHVTIKLNQILSFLEAVHCTLSKSHKKLN